MIPVFAPPWAEIFGEDDFGIFAEFQLQGVPFVWRWIPPGAFLMGSPEGDRNAFLDEQPQHEVTISEGFWLGETPVTQAQWEALTGEQPSHFRGPRRPVESVDWPAACAFAQRLSAALPGLRASLPTEAQWEYACRAGTQGDFYDGSLCTQPDAWDSALHRLGWFLQNSDSRTLEVKQKAPNAWGLFDLLGNVWEWCLDAMRPYDRKWQLDPSGALEGPGGRVVRGGSWANDAQFCRCACRSWFHPGSHRYLGLRLAAGQEPRSAEPTGAEHPAVRPEGRGRTAGAENDELSGGMTSVANSKVQTWSTDRPEYVIILNRTEMDELFVAVSGSGGFQSLLRRFQSRCDRSTGVLELTPKDLERISRCAFGYRNGGWQGRLLRIFARTLGPRLTGKP
ncbi:MAG: formylglycine-generating enzyme family protein [Verrucomicrobia bacterium]|nr:formylglycine-generating enzyme family protein [Verrucomicrobiota bacterium]